MLRSAMEDPAPARRFSSVFAIFAFLSVPITFMSIRWWRTIHPVLMNEKDFGLSPAMLSTFFLGLASFTLLFFVLLAHRYRLEQTHEQSMSSKNSLVTEPAAWLTIPRNNPVGPAGLAVLV